MHLVLGIGRLSDEQDMPRLLHWLRSASDWRTRSNAARALAERAANEDVAGALVELLDDPSAHVTIRAAETLGSVSGTSEGTTERIRAWIESRPEAWRVSGPLLPLFARLGEIDFVDWWLQDQQPGNTDAISLGVRALSVGEEDEVFGRLRDYAVHEHSQVAAAAVEALASHWRRQRRDGTDPVLYYQVFEQALRQRDLATAYAAAAALSDPRFQPLGSVEVLQDAYMSMRPPEEIEPMVRIITSLGAIGDPDATFLLQTALQSPHEVIRDAAAAALERMTGTPGERADRRETTTPAVDWEYLRQLGRRPRLVLVTEKGSIEVELVPEQAPLTVQTITRFAEEGRYDGVQFHRVVPNFVIQGGDFDRGDGFGGPGFTIRSEFTRLPFGRDVIGMASSGKDTEGSQYFITHSMQPHLDGNYTAFGQVVRGSDIVDRIEQGDRVLRAAVRR
jgi:peptidylprolyl isomerase